MTDRPRIQEVITHGYKVVLSRGDDIPFDPDELLVVEHAIENGVIAKLRRGLFNPSYFVSIVEDVKRRYDFLEDTRLGTSESVDHQRSLGMRPLADLFANHPAHLLAGKSVKELPAPPSAGSG